MSAEFQKATALQAELAELAEALGTELSAFPTERDGDRIRALWDDMRPYRARLQSLFRTLRKQSKQPRQSLNRAEQAAHRQMSRDVRALSQRLAKWDDMHDMVMAHIDPDLQHLTLLREDTGSDRLIDLYHHALFHLANPNSQSPEAVAHDCFADIPLSIHSFEQLMRVAYRLLLVQGRAADARFLDVGCGGGTKVLAAHAYFPFCDGLDFDSAYVRAGQHLLDVAEVPGCQIFEADGITYDAYQHYDVIYFYRPLNVDARLMELEDAIFSNARPGTVILAPYTSGMMPRPGLDHPNIMDCVFIAGVEQSDADRLREEAASTDTRVITRGRDLKFDPGFWRPLLEASSQRLRVSPA